MRAGRPEPLADGGFAVTAGVGDLPTAFSAEFGRARW